MISDTDRTLEKLLQQEFGTPLPFDLSFAIPDKEFKTVSNTKNTLNCYLYDIRENRELRTVEPRLVRRADGMVEKELPPARIKLSYCITAWSPTKLTPGTAPTLDEHSLLSQVLKALLRHPLIPSDVLVGTLAGQEPPVPTTVVLPDGVKNTSDFWNAIGGQLRPSLDYSMTISLAYEPPSAGPMVTAAHVGFGHVTATDVRFATDEGFYVVGGTVRDNSTPAIVVAGAWVRVVETGQTHVTDDEGRFVIDRITSGTYTLLVRAVGFQEASRTVVIPQPDGLYDVTLVPL
jgi:hypothetical protein